MDFDGLCALGARVGDKLAARGETLAVAESSAGGLISAALLSRAGASAYYFGGAVLYTRRSRRLLLVACLCAALGIEMLQQLSRYHVFDWLDVMANAAGGLVGDYLGRAYINVSASGRARRAGHRPAGCRLQRAGCAWGFIVVAV